MKFVVTSLGTTTRAEVSQYIENYTEYLGKTVTLSVRVKSSVGLTIGINDGVTFSFSAPHSGGGAYETLTVTKTLSASAGTFQIMIGFDSTLGSSGAAASASTSYFDSAVLNLGSSAVSFVPTNPQVDFARCQRYFQMIGGTVSQFLASGQAAGTTTAYFTFRFPVRMQSAPTMTVNNVTHFSLSAANTSGNPALSALATNISTADEISLAATVASGIVAGNCTFLFPNNADASIYLSADL